jgi:hypothetical protein
MAKKKIPFGLKAWGASGQVRMRQLTEKPALSPKSKVHYMMVLLV